MNNIEWKNEICFFLLFFSVSLACSFFFFIDPSCSDQYHNCMVVVQARLCVYPYYRSVCCASCSRAQKTYPNSFQKNHIHRWCCLRKVKFTSGHNSAWKKNSTVKMFGERLSMWECSAWFNIQSLSLQQIKWPGNQLLSSTIFCEHGHTHLHSMNTAVRVRSYFIWH